MKVNDACVLTLLLYTRETWVVHRYHLKLLERFHQQYLRPIFETGEFTSVMEKCLSEASATELNEIFWNIGCVWVVGLLAWATMGFQISFCIESLLNNQHISRRSVITITWKNDRTLQTPIHANDRRKVTYERYQIAKCPKTFWCRIPDQIGDTQDFTCELYDRICLSKLRTKLSHIRNYLTRATNYKITLSAEK